jgi:hypothetical protein
VCCKKSFLRLACLFCLATILLAGCGVIDSDKDAMVEVTESFYKHVKAGEMEAASQRICTRLRNDFLQRADGVKLEKAVKATDKIRVIRRETGEQIGQKSVHVKFDKGKQSIPFYIDVDKEGTKWVICPVVLKDIYVSDEDWVANQT